MLHLRSAVEKEKVETLFDDGNGHRFLWLGAGDPTEEKGIPSNQFMVVHNGAGVVLDPGGYHVFMRVFDKAMDAVGRDGIEALFLSHQDPDITASLTDWLKVRPNMRVVVSRLWERFLLHLPLEEPPVLESLEDEGGVLSFGGSGRLEAIPAHFLHSPGNFQVYDPVSKILFTGDVGASERRPGDPLFVSDFQEHARRMEGFHRRYMASNKAVKNWVERVRGLDVEILAPQHGALMKREHFGPFLDWIGALNVGVDAA